jgi:hypothetical protein
MTGTDEVRWSATLSDTRAQAAIAARRYGVPPTMIEAATRRRTAGDWRGACAAADVDIHLNPDSVRRRHGAAVAEQLLADLRSLAPELLRWHLPRCGHGSGQLIEGLLIPLADYSDDSGPGIGLTLAAATPRFALDAGERMVLTMWEGRVRRGRAALEDPVVRAVKDGVRLRSAERYCLRRHRMFWDAAEAPQLAPLVDVDGPDARAITRLQDLGEVSAAWAAAGIDLPDTDEQQRLTRWLTAVPVHLPGLVRRVRESAPGMDDAVIRAGGGAIVLRGLRRTDGDISALAVPGRAGAGLPVVPAAAWARPVDADLLRFGLLQPHELHPLVAAALVPDPAAAQISAEPDEWLYRTVPHVEAPCSDVPETAAVLIRCGSSLHRVAQLDGRWQPIDHDDQATRELLLARLGGPANPCRQAALYLGTGRHVIELVEALLEHGRAGDVLRLLHEHADVTAAPDDLGLPGGGTVGEALSALRENTLQLRMILAGAPPVRDTRSVRMPTPRRRRSRRGEPARTPR